MQMLLVVNYRGFAVMSLPIEIPYWIENKSTWLHTVVLYVHTGATQ